MPPNDLTSITFHLRYFLQSGEPLQSDPICRDHVKYPSRQETYKVEDELFVHLIRGRLRFFPGSD